MRHYSKHKHGYLLVLSLVCAIILLGPSCQKICDVTKSRADQSHYNSTFPSSLEHIADSAFENTALYNLFFKDSLVSIGAKAFAETSQLESLFIPISVIYIAKDAFPDSVTLHVVQGSFAHSWADNNGYHFIVDYLLPENNEQNIFHSELLILMLCFVAIPGFINRLHIDRATVWLEKSMRPQDRPELYPINYRFP